MLAHEIIDKNITPLKVTDSVALALTKMDLLYVTRFPVVDEGVMVSTVSLNTLIDCLLYTSPSPRDRTRSRMPSSA